MSGLGSYELTHPELLSEHQLREILRNSCIEILNFEKLCKNELLEIYKRIAMPLPQRPRGGAKSLDAEAQDKPVTAVIDSEMHSLTAGLSKGIKRTSQPSHIHADKLKSINDQKSMSKKIQLCSTPKVETVCNGISKRKCDEQNEESFMKKRQKITWP